MEPATSSRVASCSSDRVRIDIRGSVLCVTMSGVIGYREALSMLWMLRRETQRTTAPALLIDLRACAVTLSPGDYVNVLRAALEKPLAIPIAFVASEWLMSLASVHVKVMRQRGFRRRFFASTACALKWLARPPRTPQDDLLL